MHKQSAPPQPLTAAITHEQIHQLKPSGILLVEFKVLYLIVPVVFSAVVVEVEDLRGGVKKRISHVSFLIAAITR